MQNSSVLVAKVKELTEAYVAARQLHKEDEMEFWNKELVYHLWRLSVTITDSRRDSSTDSGEQ